MIEGIGVDLVELDRIEKACARKERFIDRVLTKAEREQYDRLTKTFRKTEFLAGRFAAKEAFAKAAGTGLGRLSLQHMEVLACKNNKPLMTVVGYDAKKLYVSISHSKAYAIAQVIITS